MRYHPFVPVVLAAVLTSGLALAAPPAPPPAPAGPTPEAHAAELKATADRAMDAHHYDEAIAGYTEAYGVFPDPALLYNRSRAHEARAEYPDAFDDLEKFANTASPELRSKVPRLTDLLLDLRQRVATFELVCNVAGARVLVGGKEIGTTPLKPIRLNAGKVTIEILAEDQFPYKKELELKGAGSTSLDATLVAKASNGILSIRSLPTGAFVSVDGKPFGRAPTEGTLPAGTHQLVLHADGFEDSPTQAVVAAGARRELDITLHKKSILTSPWLWTVVGVVVVGTAVGVVAALLIEKGAGTGDGFTPGQVAGPLRW
jgi:hypothetical protein